MDIFKLEQKIMQAWNTGDDIELLYTQYLDGEEVMSEDEVSNALLGIQTLHNMRMQALWTIFEELVETRRLYL